MNFEVLENFEWYNEPENVRFEANDMVVYAKEGTDFWQSIQRGFKKDNGHFFFCRKVEDFQLVLKWTIEDLVKFSQCGIMLRIDERNWFKASIEKETSNEFIITSSLTNGGHSDWSKTDVSSYNGVIWFKIVKVGDEYEVFYSVDGINFVKFKMFYMFSFEDVKVGACISSLEEENFSAILSDIYFEDVF